MYILTKTIAFFALIILIPTYTLCLPVAKVTGVAIDETGNPIVNGKVYIVFVNPSLAAKQTSTNLITDAEGKFAASDECYMHIGFRVDKEGFYQSSAGYQFKERSWLLNRWEPWNPTIPVILKKKRNPVPMYAKTTGTLKVPVLDVPIGYDLEKGDWVAPYGNGMISDFIFELHAESKSYSEYSCDFTLTFQNKLDGIQEYKFDDKDHSSYRWPFEAPLTGYEQSLSKQKLGVPGKGLQSNLINNIKYIFRVRTKIDKDGKIISAAYGKIPYEFNFDPTGNIHFSYYFNPDGTSNLEFDPENNLFKWHNRKDQLNHALTTP